MDMLPLGRLATLWPLVAAMLMATLVALDGPAAPTAGAPNASWGATGKIATGVAALASATPADPRGDLFQALLARSRDAGPLAPDEAVSLLLLLDDHGEPRELAANIGRILAPRGLDIDWRPG